MTLNHLMVRLQPWRFRECGVPLHYHCSQVHSDLMVVSMGQIEQTMYKQMTYVKLWLLDSNTWGHLTVCKKELMLIEECYQQNVFTNHMYKQDLALNNLQWLICYKTKPVSEKLQSSMYVTGLWHRVNAVSHTHTRNISTLYTCTKAVIWVVCSWSYLRCVPNIAVDQSGLLICVSHPLRWDPFACLMQLWPTVLLVRCPRLLLFHSFTCRKWTRWSEFKTWTRLFSFHLPLMPLGKVWIQLFSLYG